METRQLTPTQPGQPEDEHEFAVSALARCGQRVKLGQGQGVTLSAGPATRWPPDRCGHVLLHTPVSHSERED